MQVQRELQADEGQFDALTWEKLRQLAICKNKAVEDEDYEAAKLCKQRIAELKEHATRIKELEALKMQAVAAEDYDGARNLKREIDRLRNIDPPQPLLPVASPMPFRGQPPPEGPEAGNFASGNFAPHPSGGQMQFSGDFAAHPGAGGGSGLFGNGGAPPPQGPAFPLGAQSPQVCVGAVSGNGACNVYCGGVWESKAKAVWERACVVQVAYHYSFHPHSSLRGVMQDMQNVQSHPMWSKVEVLGILDHFNGLCRPLELHNNSWRGRSWVYNMPTMRKVVHRL